MAGYPSRALTSDQVAAIARVPNEIHCSFSSDTEIPLTTTLQKITVWTESDLSASVGVSESDGTFTVSTSAGVSLVVVRDYRNGDTNPADEVDATISFVINNEEYETNTAIIPPATNPGGDGTLTKTTPFLLPVASGDQFEIYVSAEDNDADPEDASLTGIKFTVIPAYAT